MAPLPEEGAEGGSGRAEGDEHGGEAGDEEERGDENVPPRLGLALVDQRLDAGARQIAEIRRRQRQHAGADERDEPGAEGGRDGDVGHGRYRWPFGRTASNMARSLGRISDAAESMMRLDEIVIREGRYGVERSFEG